MSHDSSVGVFSSEGRIYQVEYAIKSVTLAPTGLGLTTRDGTVLVCEVAQNSPLQILPKMACQIDKHIAALPVGYPADAAILISYLRAEAQSHFFSFEEPVPIELLANELSDKFTNFRTKKRSEAQMGRPFGCAVFLASADKLIYCDPAGNCISYKAKAAGSGGVTAQEQLEEQFKEMSGAEGLKAGIAIVKDVIEGGYEKIQAAIVGRDGIRFLSPDEIKAAVL